MNHLGLFSGILGFEEAFRRAGANLIAVCEKDKECRRVIRRHRPDVEIIEDVKEITRKTFARRSIELITGGFPCQDLSVAGRRAGLAGQRSGLWFDFVRVIAGHQPRWVVIENVPGLLSSNDGRDFAIILRGLVKLGYCVSWRILDSQFDGVAQRRQRVFIVASLGTADAAEILFEREGGARDSAPSREAGQDVAGTLSARASAGGGLGTDFECGGGLIAGAVTSKWAKGTGGPAGDGCYNLVAFQSKASTTQSMNPSADIVPTLDVCKAGGTVVAFTERTRAEGRTLETQDDLAYAVTNPGSGGRTHSRQIAGSFGVRRLTPLECERLQGFPDRWTQYGDDGREISDSARYRMLGNAVCLPTVEWIARRILNKSFLLL